jgi:hypothetical protein
MRLFSVKYRFAGSPGVQQHIAPPFQAFNLEIRAECGALAALPIVGERRILGWKNTEPMQTIAKRVADKSRDGAGAPPGSFAKLLWQRLVELWIFLTILTFFLVRVLGSHAAQGIFSRLVHRHPL